MTRIGWIAALVLLVTRVGAQQVAWTYVPPAGHVDVSPAIGDVNGDGRADIVVGTTAGFVVALDARGKEIWTYRMRDAVCIVPTLADVNADGMPEVVAMNRQGDIVCLSARKGDVLWSTKLPGAPQWGATCPAVADLRGDGDMRIVTTTRDGWVVCLRGTSGDRDWAYRANLGIVMSPAIADLTGDGRPEVLVGSEKASLLCLTPDGKLLWKRNEGAGGSPFVYNLGPKGSPRIFCGMGKALHALDARGRTLWSYPMKKELDSAIAIADADGDGAPEVYAVDLAGHVVSLTLDGKPRWSAEVDERSRRSPSIGDVDGDGKLEILIAGYSSAMHVFAPDGTLKARVPLPGHSNGTPTLVVLDGALSVVVPVAGAPLQVFRWPGARAGARVLWAECRYDGNRTGVVAARPAQSPVKLSVDPGKMSGRSGTATAVVRNPRRRALVIRMEATPSRGTRVASETRSSAPRIAHRLPYTMPSGSASTMAITCRVLDGSRTVARRTRMLYTNPFSKELARLGALVQTAQSRVPRLRDARGIEDRLALVAVRLAALRARTAGGSPISEAEYVAARKVLGDLAAEASAAGELATVAAAASSDGVAVRVCAANPWAPFGGMSELTEGRSGSKDLSVYAFSGETETAALNVFNLSSQPRSFRVELAPLRQGDSSVLGHNAVRRFEVIDVPTERCDMEADALSPLSTAQVLHVPAWSARQLWLNVDTRALAPGDWRGSIRLRSIDIEPVEASAPLAVTVASAQSPEKHMLRQCGWGYVEGSMLKDHIEAALADQVEHGTNVYVGSYFPKARFDADGNLVGEIDWADHDTYVKRYSPHGIVLFCGYQGALQGPAPEGSAAYTKAHIQWLRAWVKHLAGMGVGYDGWALYPVDEPGLSKGLVETYLRFAKLAREADPRILMYTDPVAGITEDELRSMLPYVDIWCPNRGGLLLDPKNAAKLAIIKSSGKQVWTYECDDNAKHQPPLGYYRGLAWLAWRHGLTGIGFWSYCTSQDDPWFVPKLRYDYLLVYPGNGVVSSKRWEAVRDGIEDYSMLAALRAKVAAAGVSAKAEDLAAARRLLGEAAAFVGGFCTIEDDSALITAGDLPKRRRIEDRRWATYERLRREIGRLLEAL